MHQRETTTYGFSRTSKVLQKQIRRTSESRGFAQSRILTHWSEIVGAEIAAMARPVEVAYGRGNLGATLVLLTTGAQAPLLEMQKLQIRDRVNATYGYNAVARIRITQTSATGFAEGQVAFAPAPPAKAARVSDSVKRSAQSATQAVGDPGLRAALERLATNVISKHQRGA